MGRAPLLVIGELWILYSPFCLLDHYYQMLLSNHFLTGHEVAQVLVHYEGHTGMAFW